MRFALLALLVLQCSANPAMAHSWYPKACCNDRDCRPIDKLVGKIDGSYEVWSGAIYLIVPRGFPIQQSEDSEAHICFVPDFYSGEPDILCVFMPNIS